MASVDVGHALKRFGSPAANLQLSASGDALSPSLGWRAAWEVFLSTALPQVVRAQSDSALIGYYHPWSDVMLLTGWKRSADGQSHIETAHLVPGSTIRGSAQVEAIPRRWQQGETFAPEGVGQLTAQTAKAFEARFGDANADPLIPMSAEDKDSLAGFAGLSFADFCLETMAAHGDGQGLPAVMWLWSGLRDEAQGGPAVRSDSIGEGLNAIGKLDPKVRASFTPVSYLTTDKAELLMLASTLQPNLFVLVQTGGSEGRDSLRRVSLLSFQAFYAAQSGVSK